MIDLAISKEFYVYAHYTADTNELFYIGKGKNKRAWQANGKNRSNYWHNIVNKHQGFRVEILLDKLDEASSYNEEAKLVEQHSPRANIAKGGHGPIGVTRSAETRNKISIAQSGRLLSEETKKRISVKQKESYSRSDRQSIKGKKQSMETRLKKSQNSKTPTFKAINIQTGEEVGVFNNYHLCGEVIGINYKYVALCVRGKQKRALNFRFEKVSSLPSSEEVQNG